MGAQFDSYDVCETRAEADAADVTAIYGDFRAVGEDLAWARELFERRRGCWVSDGQENHGAAVGAGNLKVANCCRIDDILMEFCLREFN